MTRLAVHAVVAVAAAVAAGSLAFATPAGAASAADWSKSADAICAKYDKETAKIASPTSSKSLIAASEQLVAIGKRRSSELAKLKRPSGDAAAIGKLLGTFEQQVAMVKSLIDAVKHDDKEKIKQVMAHGSSLNDSAVSLAKKLGARKCAD